MPIFARPTPKLRKYRKNALFGIHWKLLDNFSCVSVLNNLVLMLWISGALKLILRLKIIFCNSLYQILVNNLIYFVLGPLNNREDIFYVIYMIPCNGHSTKLLLFNMFNGSYWINSSCLLNGQFWTFLKIQDGRCDRYDF